MSSKKLIATLLAVVVVGAAAGFAYRIYLNPAHDNAIDLVPSDAFLYANVFLDPSTHQKQALGALLKHFPQARTPDLAKNELELLLDRALASKGIDFTHDVEPWIGRQIAFFVESSDGNDPHSGLLVATRDTDAAQKTLDALSSGPTTEPEPSHASYRGIDYEIAHGMAMGVVGDFAVVTNDAGAFESVVRAHDGTSLSDEVSYARAIAPLPRDRIVTLYLQTSKVVSLAAGAAGTGAEATALGFLSELQPVAVGAFLRADGIVIDAAVPREGVASTATSPRILEDLPGDTWAALSVPKLGSSLSRLLANIPAELNIGLGAGIQAQTGLDLKTDLLSWMDDAAIFAAGHAPIRGGAIVHSSDPATSRATVERLGESLLTHGLQVKLTPKKPDRTAFTIALPDLPRPLSVVATDGQVDALFGRPKERSGTKTLGDTAVFKEAQQGLGPDFSMHGFIDPQAASSLEVAVPQGSSPTVQSVVSPLSYIALGTRGDHDTLFARIVIGVD